MTYLNWTISLKTQHVSNVKPLMIDNFYTNQKTSLFNSSTVETGISGHRSLICTMLCSTFCKGPPKFMGMLFLTARNLFFFDQKTLFFFMFISYFQIKKFSSYTKRRRNKLACAVIPMKKKQTVVEISSSVSGNILRAKRSSLWSELTNHG